MEHHGKSGLPDNAYTELKKGEAYTPIVPADSSVKEITFRSVFTGIIMAILFSGAAAFLGLKIAQVFEAAIPIAILAVGLGTLFRRRSTILENVVIQSIGAASGLIVAGAIFTLPALYILGLDAHVDLFQLFMAATLGGVLGVLFLVPLRRYFVSDMHGKLPFPEATATTEVLVAGAKGGRQAKVLAVAAIIGGIYDFVSIAMRGWAEEFTTGMVQLFAPLTDKVKAVMSINTGAAVLGLGYIVGLRYAMIIACGSFLSWFVMIPMVNYLGGFMQVAMPPADPDTLIASMSAHQIFSTYVRYIGIGAIFAAGLIGIVKASPIILQAFTKGFREIFASRKRHEGETGVERTQRDIPMAAVIVGMLLVVVVSFVFFRYSVLVGQVSPLKISLIAIAVVFVISFLFTTVAARAIAIVGINPVSGMTLITLILSCLILVAVGLSGPKGMMAALVIGGMVCTALAMSGGLITDLKVGYWIGSTPSRQQWCKILGTVFAAATVAGVIVMLNKVYGFVPTIEHPKPLPAPQANAMAAVIKGIMAAKSAPWLLYGVGAVIAVLMEMLGIAPLAFALGMYIPLSLNTPILVGALVAHYVQRSAGKDEALGRARRERGTLIASGFIAGGALMGVLGAVLKYIESETGVTILPDLANDGAFGNWLGLAMLAALCVYVYVDSKRAKKEA
ncbi:MAG: oligopeptide transporter, OPT family [Proteobacteria bacterium]|nr:oligopeptide transporter, OPT family [Pseudomonadota bacterium]